MGKESGTNAKQVPVGVLAKGNSLRQFVRRVPKSYKIKCTGVAHDMNSNALTARVPSTANGHHANKPIAKANQSAHWLTT